MGVSTKLAIGLMAANKIAILLYINFYFELGTFIQLIVIPSLLLEAIAVYGYLTEFPAAERTSTKHKLYPIKTPFIPVKKRAQTACGLGLF